MQDIPLVKHMYFISRVETRSQSLQKHFQKQLIFKVVNSNFSCNETATFVQNFLVNLDCITVFFNLQVLRTISVSNTSACRPYRKVLRSKIGNLKGQTNVF